MTRLFTKLKLRAHAVPVARRAVEAHERGIPVHAADALEFPDDPAVALPRPAVHARPRPARRSGVHRRREVEFYLPEGTWTSWLTGEVVTGGGWRSEKHGFDTLPLYVRDGATVPLMSDDGTLAGFPA